MEPLEMEIFMVNVVVTEVEAFTVDTKVVVEGSEVAKT